MCKLVLLLATVRTWEVHEGVPHLTFGSQELSHRLAVGDRPVRITGLLAQAPGLQRWSSLEYLASVIAKQPGGGHLNVSFTSPGGGDCSYSERADFWIEAAKADPRLRAVWPDEKCKTVTVPTADILRSCSNLKDKAPAWAWGSNLNEPAFANWAPHDAPQKPLVCSSGWAKCEDDLAPVEQMIRISTDGFGWHSHFDEAHNIFIVLQGTKRVWLSPPDAYRSWRVYPRFHQHARQARSHVLAGHAAESSTPAEVELLLGPGEAVFIPEYTFHRTKSQGCSVAYSHWLRPSPLSQLTEVANNLIQRQVYSYFRPLVRFRTEALRAVDIARTPALTERQRQTSPWVDSAASAVESEIPSVMRAFFLQLFKRILKGSTISSLWERRVGGGDPGSAGQKHRHSALWSSRDSGGDDSPCDVHSAIAAGVSGGAQGRGGSEAWLNAALAPVVEAFAVLPEWLMEAHALEQLEVGAQGMVEAGQISEVALLPWLVRTVECSNGILQ